MTVSEPLRHSVFDICSFVLHGRSTAVSTDPLTVMIPSGRWAYGVSFPAHWAAPMTEDGVITVRIRVLSGAAFVLSLAADQRRVTDERLVAAGSVDQDVDLVAVPLTACGSVVVRNAADLPTTVIVRSIDYAVRGSRSPGAEGFIGGDVQVLDWCRYYGNQGLTLDERFRSARYAMLEKPERMPWVHGLVVVIEPNDELSRALYISGTYEPASLVVVRRLLPDGGVFLDVGANSGIFSMVASRSVGASGAVYSFEPSEREFARLTAHLQLNGLTNVRAIRKAIADRDGTTDLRVARFPHAGQNTLAAEFAYDGVALDRIESVKVASLDTVVAEERIGRVDLVKVDAEGAECRVLAGAAELLRRQRPAFIVEAVEPALRASGANPADLVERFRSAGYTLMRIDASGALALPAHTDRSDGNIVAVPDERVDAALRCR